VSARSSFPSEELRPTADWLAVLVERDVALSVQYRDAKSGRRVEPPIGSASPGLSTPRAVLESSYAIRMTYHVLRIAYGPRAEVVIDGSNVGGPALALLGSPLDGVILRCRHPWRRHPWRRHPCTAAPLHGVSFWTTARRGWHPITSPLDGCESRFSKPQFLTGTARRCGSQRPGAAPKAAGSWHRRGRSIGASRPSSG
jgi:hypothetical protein